MENNPLVTVIIPNYNHSKFLKERIESVLNQTYSGFRVYILDDYSTDNSMKVIKQYEGHPKIKSIIVNQENSGSVFKQWVKGIGVADGKYIWIAESDDFAHERFLEETVKLAEQREDIGFVFTDSYNVDEKSKLKGKLSVSHFLLNKIIQLSYVFCDKNKASLMFISHILIPNASAVLFNLKRIKETVNLNEMQSFKNVGDQFTYLSIYLKYNIGYVNRPLNYRRNHKQNTTELNFSNGLIYKEQLKLIDYFFDKIKNLKTSKAAFNYYLKKSFLKATDFSFLIEMKALLNKLFREDLISLKKYLYLSGYIVILKFFSGKTSFIVRKKIKQILLE